MKKLLSVLLTVCMLVSMIPAVNIAHAAEASGVTVTYPFSTALAYSSDAPKPQDIKYTSSKSLGRVEWYLSNQTFPSSYGTYALAVYTMSDAEYASYKIKVPKAGKYTVRQKFAYRSVGTKGNMYILDIGTTDIAEAIKASTPILTIDTYSATLNTTAAEIRSADAPEATAEWVAPAAGEYIVAWQGTGDKNSMGRWLVSLGDLVLDGGDGTAPIYAESLISKPKLNLQLGDYAEISTSKLIKSDGSAGNANDIAALT
ncbi:MAG: hypothetical protein IJ299_03760, partial [Oscillospiraceae bacterium]|nr:hypothetical protein [Oscillospiraceae bacterium]